MIILLEPTGSADKEFYDEIKTYILQHITIYMPQGIDPAQHPT